MHRHYKKTFIAVLAMLLATVTSIVSQTGYSSPAQAAPVVDPGVYTVSITPAQQYQKIQGWGTSLAWWANIIGGWSDSQRTALADALYSRSKGIGLNVVRYNLGADGPGNVCHDQMREGGNVPSFEPTQGNYVWTNDANQLWFAQAAKQRGANVFEGFVNSPPAWMLLNGCTAGAASGQDNLDPAHYNDFASYLATIAQHFHQNFGITLQTVEPFNEPQGTWWTSGGRQEGMYVTHGTQNAVIPLIANALAANKASAYTSISAPDDSSVNWSLGDYNSYSSSTRADIAQWNTHSYGGSDSDRAYAYANIGLNDNKNLSMSEWGTGSRGTTVGAALALSQQILDDEHNLHPSSWVAWQAVNEAGDTPDDVWGLAYRDGNNTITYPMRYYAMGNYSKFVEQGSTMIGNSDPNTFTAYNAKEHSLVIVATNSTASSTPINYDLSQFTTVGSKVTPYQTSSTQNLQKLANIQIANSAFAATLPAQSITTFVIPDVTYTGATVSGYYKLVNRNSGKVLDVVGSSTANGAKTDQLTDNGGSSQQWTLTPVAGGYYRLFNRNSGQDLDVAGYSSADGAAVDQWPDTGGTNQQWSLVPVTGGYYKLVSRNSGKLLDVAGYSSADGAAVDQWPDNGGTNQQWSLVPIPSTTSQIVPQTPPMGWSSWNAHFDNINASVIQAATDALVNTGMQAAGYQYVNIDEGWWKGTRDANGNISVDTTLWPGGMQAIAAYIHSKGLKAGIYTDIGVDGCGGTNQGSYGHYLQDMLQFEQWGFDYVKVDWCGGKALNLNPATQYAQMRDAIVTATAQTGHPMGLSICEWGLADPWHWGPTTGNLWRVSTDISSVPNSATWAGVLKNFDTATLYPEAQSAGAYNDPDMMEVGAQGLTDTENQSHFSLWAIAGAPLLAGNDITTMSTTTQSILTNSEVIAVDQDPLGLQGTKVSEPASGLQVWSKVLSGSGQRAVVLLNRTASPASITVNWSDIGLASGGAQVRDLWAHDTKGEFSSSYSATVPSHGVVMLTITGKEGAQTTYGATSPTNTLTGSATAIGCDRCSGGYAVGYVGTGDGSSGTLQFNAVQASLSGPQVVTITYVNGDSKPRAAALNVNGIFTTTVNFPSTLDGKSAKVGTVKIIADLNAGNNTLTFSNSVAWAPAFVSITLPAATVATTATTYEAEATGNTLTGSAVVASCATCSGGHDVGYVGNADGRNGVLQFNNIVVNSAGDHQIVISYINGEGFAWGIGSSRTAYISINGAAPIAVDFPASGDWNLVLTMKLTVNLNAGSNTIAFSNSTYWTPDIDKIDVA